MSVSPITSRLKSDNWDLHQIAERGGTPESMIKGTISRDEFAGYLAQSIHINRALDHALSRAVELMPELGAIVTDEQCFEPFFSEDLAFYQTEEAQSLKPGVTRFVEHIKAHAESPLHIFGLHYVRLGACNGNRFVARKLRQVFGIDHPTDGMKAHDPFGESQREKWNAFKEGIDSMDLTDAQRDELFDGTRAAYLMTINIDHVEHKSAEELLSANAETLDRDAFEQGHSVHVPA